MIRPLCLVLLAGAGLAQQPSLTVLPPDFAYVSDGQADFYIGGRNIENDYPELTIYQGGVNVTPTVGWTWVDETRVDINNDGWLESFGATAQLDLSNLTLTNDQVLEVNAESGVAAGGTIESRSGIRVLGHAQVGLAPRRLPVTSLPSELHVFLSSYGVPAIGVVRTVKIIKDGTDVTPSAVFLEKLIGEVPLESGLVDWKSEVVITTSTLGPIDASTVLEFEMTAFVPGEGLFGSSSSWSFGTGIGEIPCAGDAVCGFIQDLGITRTAGGPLSVGVTDKDQIRAATDALKAAIRACQTAAEQGQEDCFVDSVECDGITFEVALVIGGNSSTWAQPTFAGTQSMVNTLVVALGGDGASGRDGATSEAHGGDGCIAVSVGGTGSEKGYGGRAATEMDGNGTGIALGGVGGETGGQGGNGWTDCEAENGSFGGQGISGGGPGGHSGPTTTGGHGGGAGVRSTEGDIARREGGPKEGGAGGKGKHGSGACASADSAGDATADRGTSEDNT